jgi:carbohydrate kinase (thermoresistant glucokinase family)
MGVTGCGKTSVGSALAQAFGAQFADADDFHGPANIAKMAAGEALTDADRWPWLESVGQWLGGRERAVVSCSALRRVYREALLVHAPDAVFIHLAAPQQVLEQRVRARSAATDHFAGANLLDSQYATLEALGEDEPGGTVDVSTLGLEGVIHEAQAEVRRLVQTEQSVRGQNG